MALDEEVHPPQPFDKDSSLYLYSSPSIDDILMSIEIMMLAVSFSGLVDPVMNSQLPFLRELGRTTTSLLFLTYLHQAALRGQEGQRLLPWLRPVAHIPAEGGAPVQKQIFLPGWPLQCVHSVGRYLSGDHHSKHVNGDSNSVTFFEVDCLGRTRGT